MAATIEPVSDCYKFVKLYTENDIEHYAQQAGLYRKDGTHKSRFPYMSYKPCVSFNTVPVETAEGHKLKEGHDGDDCDDYPSYEFTGVQFPADMESFTQDEWYDDESGYVNSNNQFYSHNRYDTNKEHRRSSSPPPGIGKYSIAQLQNMFQIAENGKIVRRDYPSRPTVVNDAIIINRAYGNWLKLWHQFVSKIDDNLIDKERTFQYPNILFPKSSDIAKCKNLDDSNDDGYTPLTKNQKRKLKIIQQKIGYPNLPKTILCHISGRKHTWVGLDYTIVKLAHDMDHVVVVANLSRLKISGKKHKIGRRTTRGRNTHRDKNKCNLTANRSHSVSSNELSHGTTPLQRFKSFESNEEFDDRNSLDEYQDSEWVSGYNKNMIEDKLDDLLLYIDVLLSKNPKSIKVTVEIVVGKTKKVLSDMISVYTPDFFVLSKKKVTSEIRWKSQHLADNFAKTLPIPVCIVFARPMFQFELNLQNQFSSNGTITTKNEKKFTDPRVSDSKLIETIDSMINTSIVKVNNEPERPQVRSKQVRSMIEIALNAPDVVKKKSFKSSHKAKVSRAKKISSSRSNTPIREDHTSPLRALSPTKSLDGTVGIENSMKHLERPKLKQVQSYNQDLQSHKIGVPLTPSRSVSTSRPSLNLSHRYHSHESGNDSTHLRKVHSSDYNTSDDSTPPGGFFSSIFGGKKKKGGFFNW